MKKLISVFFLFFTFVYTMVAAPPVPFSGKLAVDGKNFHGNALFAFSIVDGEGKVHWNHSEKQGAAIENFVVNGRYLVLLGGQGMQALPANLFLENDNLFLRVRVDLQDGKGVRLLEPDQPITSTPYALAAELARLAEKASVADGVTPGAITAGMIDTGLLADLNRTAGITEITREMLPQDVRDDLNRTITRDRLSSDVLSDLNRSITKSMLSQEVLNELNSSSGGGGVVPGSLLAVPANQSAPLGYSLYEEGEPKDLVWEEKAPVSVARFAFDGVEVLGGKIYSVGGKLSSSVAKNIAERYDPATNTWETLANMSAARYGVACAVLEGKLYAIGGVGLTSVEVFDPSNDTWSAGIALPSEVNRGTAITVNGKIYLIGGMNASGQNINQVLCYDPSTNQWSTKTNMPTSRYGMKLVWFENRIWAIGGMVGSDISTNKVESYDPSTDNWQAEASLTTARHWPVAWVANGRIYVGGGKDGSSVLNSIEVYDPATKQWISAGNLPGVNWVADSVVLNDKAYVVAGNNGSGYSNKVFAADLNASVSGLFDLYRKDGNASSGVPVAQVANGSIGPSKLSSEVSNALKPVVIGQPSTVTAVGGTSTLLSVDATGVNNSYQWKKNGVEIAGATNHTLSITDLNASQHEGNYTVVVSNAFGSATSSVAQIDVNGSLTEGLVGWWKFDEVDGNIASDSSGNGNDGNLTNGPTWAEGKIGGALSFDDVDDYVDLGNILPASYTKVVWFYKKVSGIGNFLSFEGSHALWVGGDGNLKVQHVSNNTVDNRSSNQVCPLSKWAHLTATYNNTSERMSLFLDGELILEEEAFPNIGANQGLFVGKHSSTETLFGGLLDDIRIYDRALSAVEVKALYELGEEPVQESGSGTTTVVNGTVADGSITTNQLSEQILKYLKPEITQQPTASTIFADTNNTISVSAEGKYLTYQWKKNGTVLAGETNSTLSITDANATQHDGNYSVVVSNDFGSVESGEVEILINHSLLDGLIAWWKFDETSGTIAYDSSGNSHDANLTNGPTWVTGKIGGALSFDGSDDMVRTGLSGMHNQDFTWSTWIKTSDTSGAVVGVSADSWSNGGSSLYIFGGKPKIDVCNIGNKLGSLSINTNQWVHYLLTVEDSGGSSDPVKIFVNGQIDVDSQINWFAFSGQAFELRIGHVPVHGDYYSGIIDDVRIYDRVLSNAEVQDLYQLGQ